MMQKFKWFTEILVVEQAKGIGRYIGRLAYMQHSDAPLQSVLSC
jgi:hypothetical protein